MCKQCVNNIEGFNKIEKKFRLADFFEMHWDTYVQHPKAYIQPEQYKAVNALRTCRTAALGVDYYACPDCGELSEVYHSCKNRFCPNCSWQDTVKWADSVKKNMLNIPHRHVVFTLPYELNELIKRNHKYLLNVLLRVTADVFKDWMENKFQLQIGIISVLHTFGEVKNYHPHVHMIVSWGGIDRQTGELKALDTEYVNYEFLQKKFRCKFEDELVMLYDNKKMEHSFTDRVSLMSYLKGINKKKWVIHLEPPMSQPGAVVRYIGRYSKRACISEYKITAIEGEHISFRYKDYKEKNSEGKPVEKELTLHYEEFFPRLLQHVPLPYFRLVRYYGLYSNKGHIPQTYLYAEPSEQEEGEFDPDIDMVGDIKYCKVCHREKEYQYTEIRKRVKEYYWQKSEIEPNLSFKYKRKAA